MPENRSPLASIAKYVGAKVLAVCLGLGVRGHPKPASDGHLKTGHL